MIATKLDRKNRLVTELLDHVIMTGVVFVFFAPVVISDIVNDSMMRVGPYEVFCFSLYFNKDIYLGRSIAKRILGLQVLNNRTGLPAGPLRCLIRNLTLVLWPIEVVASLINVNRRIGDYLAGTRLAVYDPKVSARPNWGTIIASLPLAMGLIWVCWMGPLDRWMLRIVLPKVARPSKGGYPPGAILWKYRTGGPVDGSPALGKHIVYFGSGDSCLYALRLYL